MYKLTQRNGNMHNLWGYWRPSKNNVDYQFFIMENTRDFDSSARNLIAVNI